MPVDAVLPLLLSFYGDDFTGSTDVMEALATAGIRTVLFLEPPTARQLRRFEGIQAVGMAGTSRTMTPDQMDRELRPAFERLRALGAPILHYKVCSTFDSSPDTGSIGRAIDVGQDVSRSSWVPLVVGAPPLGRYCLFGNLFARSGPESEVYRLDRHPTMRRHPATPMDESDLRVILGRQTAKPVGLIDAVQMAEPGDALDRRLDGLLAGGSKVVLFDTLTEAHLESIGRILWGRASVAGPLFAVGSSGIEYALTHCWRQAGWLPPPPSFSTTPADRLVVVSGSCSPVTDRQIDWAVRHGFVDLPLCVERLVDAHCWQSECERAAAEAVVHLARGRSVILHTGRGPQDPRIEAARRSVRNAGCPGSEISGRLAELLGRGLGRILDLVVHRTGVRRAATTGGDTSGYVARDLGIEALEMAAPAAPGSPLCRVYAPGRAADGLEMVFKGGQVGAVDFFGSLMQGDKR